MICPYCGKEALFGENKMMYGKNYGKSYTCYYCKDCDAYVGCHNNTNIPFGTMANKELRYWRKKAHEAIDPLWKNKTISRREIYTLMDKYFKEETHVGSADIDKCKKIIEFIKSKYFEGGK